MKIENAVALVTGANRGIGLAFMRELLARGARKVYAGARNPAMITQSGVQPLRLDVTRSDDVTAAVKEASDVTLVINNAGIAQRGGFLAPDSEDTARRLFETNFFAVLRISKAFADSQGQWWWRVTQCVVGCLMGEPRRLSRLLGQQVRRLVPHQCIASRVAGAEDTGARIAYGLRRHRPHTWVRCPEIQSRGRRQARTRRTRSGHG